MLGGLAELKASLMEVRNDENIYKGKQLKPTHFQIQIDENVFFSEIEAEKHFWIKRTSLLFDMVSHQLNAHVFGKK